MQHFLKLAGGAAGAEVVAAELFEQLFVAVDDPLAALDARLGRIASPALAAHFKRSGPRWVYAWSCPPGLRWKGGQFTRSAFDGTLALPGEAAERASHAPGDVVLPRSC